MPVKPVWSSLFCMKTPVLLDFTSRSLHRRVFLTDRSRFLRFGPSSFSFFEIKSLILFRPYLSHFSFVFSVLYVHAIISTSRTILCLCFVLIILFSDCFLFYSIICLYVNVWSVEYEPFEDFAAIEDFQDL
jgi:hypothetical protein